jgi:hypothetical protein
MFVHIPNWYRSCYQMMGLGVPYGLRISRTPSDGKVFGVSTIKISPFTLQCSLVIIRIDIYPFQEFSFYFILFTDFMNYFGLWTMEQKISFHLDGGCGVCLRICSERQHYAITDNLTFSSCVKKSKSSS